MLTSCDDAEEENDDGSFDEIDDGVTVMSFNRRRSSQCMSCGLVVRLLVKPNRSLSSFTNPCEAASVMRTAPSDAHGSE